MTVDVIDLRSKLAQFADHWAPRRVARLNDYDVKVVRILGDFVWHSHEDTDELFLVVSGDLTIDFRDHRIVVGPGQLCIVPRGVEHRPRADAEVTALLIEPSGVVNTGDAGGELTSVTQDL
ncbi:cupin domain-containing protein [Gordonia soli]|uniref:Cupin type-2 domain-containing protein n=1 Tax=Gordonia soli NBRC 108243 TaxID=1223545 RepID=M0QS65_9ACTN|nr:cupin domain-containing protein [Gordonia soli]GAC70907.1 hypothetical protein GS4_43_00340 [Gordonia soli NBRC 108243]